MSAPNSPPHSPTGSPRPTSPSGPHVEFADVSLSKNETEATQYTDVNPIDLDEGVAVVDAAVLDSKNGQNSPKTDAAPQPAQRTSSQKHHRRNISSASMKEIFRSLSRRTLPDVEDDEFPLELTRDADGTPTERIVFANDHERNDPFKYCNNYVSTAKYTLLTFLPLNLFEQFQKIANLYFLFLIILQMVPQISSLNPITSAFPLLVVLTITAVKDGIDDKKRHDSDKTVNTREVEVLRDGEWKEIIWQEVKSGDIVRVENDDNVPADLVVLSTSLPDGACYVETAELDGETNLKLRQAKKITADALLNDEELAKFRVYVQCEPPNTELHHFAGKLVFPQATALCSVPLDNDNIMLRGMVLRNTEWVVGLAVFTGHDTKLMMNSSGARHKRTKLDLTLNSLIGYIFVILVVICFISGVGAGVWAEKVGRDFEVYLPFDSDITSPALVGVTSFFTFVILYATLVPISLYISVEMIRLGLSMLIDWDLRMYHTETNTPARARTTTLNEELGQIDYIFSDKTGTLTQNVMRFLKCSIRGKMYGKGKTEATRAAQMLNSKEKRALKRTLSVYEEVDFSSNPYYDPDFKFFDEGLWLDAKAHDPDVDAFFRLLALCHTVQADEKDGRLKYAAQSPDEAALVGAAKNFGYVFKSRTQDRIYIEVQGVPEEYEILNTLEFNSDRKRMSIILRDLQGKILLLCKGADNVMLSWRALKNEEMEKTLNQQLEAYSTEGLRTLVLGMREVDEKEYFKWDAEYKVAQLELDDRTAKVDAVSEKIECKLDILGCTAIEDRLQEGVPQTIFSLRRAAIKIWVLTGDKQETAINIGYACQLLSNEHRILLINERSADTVKDKLDAIIEEMDNDSTKHYALVIDGLALSFALEEDLKMQFLQAAERCSSVVCCRVSPIQKALVVKLVKDNRKAITLAIGDGANDVSMIQNAHIGIGISGLEGRQAVLASDYSIAQFRFLERLLLIHGRWAYLRMCRFLQYFFYKNFVFTLGQFWFAIFSAWSGQTLFDAWFVTFYNVIFTSLPVIAAGMMEQDVNDRVCMIYPHLYEAGHRDVLFNRTQFFISLLRGTYQSIICFFIPFGVAGDLIMSNGTGAGFQWMSTLVSACVVITVNLQMALDLYRWTIINAVFIVLSMVSWFVFAWFMYGIPSMPLIAMVGFYGVPQNSQSTAVWWFTLIITVTAALLPGFIFQFVSIYLNPLPMDIVREITLLGRRARVGSRKIDGRLDRHGKKSDKPGPPQKRARFAPTVSTIKQREPLEASPTQDNEIRFGSMVQPPAYGAEEQDPKLDHKLGVEKEANGNLGSGVSRQPNDEVEMSFRGTEGSTSDLGQASTSGKEDLPRPWF